MNLLKRFIRNDNADMESEGLYDDLYVDPEDMPVGVTDNDADSNVASLNSTAKPEIRPATPDKVSLKLLQPKSHTEATKIADRLKDGSIVLLDISNLSKDQARRLVDFLAGVAYVLGGEMIKTNKNTIVVSPAGVDIAGITAQDEPAPAPAAQEPVYDEIEELPVEESYEEV